MGQYNTIETGSTDERMFTLVKRANGDPITAGTVNWYLQARSGANAGKWWRISDNSWQVAETGNAMTHQADGHWTRALDQSPFADGIRFLEYAKESGDLHVSVSRSLKAEYTPSANSARRVDLGLWLGTAPFALDSQRVQVLVNAFSTAGKAELQVEAQDALQGYHLDHLIPYSGTAGPDSAGTTIDLGAAPFVNYKDAVLYFPVLQEARRIVSHAGSTCVVNRAFDGMIFEFYEYLILPAWVLDVRVGDIEAAEVSAIQSGLATSAQATNIQTAVDDLATDHGSIQGDLETALDSLAALEAVLDAIKGVGWTNQTLVALKTAIDAKLDSGSYTAPDNAGIAAVKAVTDKLDTAMEADGPVHRFTANALEESPSASGAFTEDDRDLLESVYVKVSGAIVEPQTIATEGGSFEVYQGYDYLGEDDRAIEFTCEGMPALEVGEFASLKYQDEKSFLTGTVSLVEAGTYLISFDLPSSITDTLEVNTSIPLRLSAQTENGNTILIRRMTMKVR
jgi:hypothetical protein